MLQGIREAWDNLRAKIDEINKRYAQPRIKMTPMVRLSLLLLRLYLIVLLLILAYKFVTMLK